MPPSDVISIIIVNFNGLQYTRQCLETIFQYHAQQNIEVIVVDNNSSDKSQSELTRLFPQITLISLPENRGFGAANNIGAQKAKGDLFFFVNNDTLFNNEAIESLGAILSSQHQYGMIGPKLLNGDRSFQRSFGKFPTLKTEFLTKNGAESYPEPSIEEMASSQPIEKDWITGAAIMIKRELFEMIGGFDEHYFMYFEDIDLCKTLNERGYKTYYLSSVTMIHLGGKSYGKKNERVLFEYRRSQLRYYDKHNSILQRIMVRAYILFKFFPKIFLSTEHKNSIKILTLIFSSHNNN
jgi:N-acetylglucosaminyl-diphospho-decaprenol L-rhamnosyltransferase